MGIINTMNNQYPFCAAPWVEGVLGSKGEFRPCAKLPNIFTLNWQEIGLEKAFNSLEMSKFREQIVAGIPPHPTCQTCISTNTTRPLEVSLRRAVNVAIHEMEKIENSIDFSSLYIVRDLLYNRFWEEKSKENFTKCLDLLDKYSEEYPHLKGYLDKLLKIVKICKSFLDHDLIVPVVASLRQISLKNKCNAKCIHCPGLYSGWIHTDDELEVKYYDEAFSHIDDITDFFMNGAEFLFVKEWKNISSRLRKAYVKTAISTNGILLTKRNIKYLIDNECMDVLNISLDGGTKETIETIRAGLNFDILMRNLDYMFQYAYEKKYQFSLSFSFVMMRRNYTELPKLIEMVSEKKYSITPDNKYPVIAFSCSTLDANDVPGYNEFVSDEYIDLVDYNELKKVFDKCREYCDKYNVKIVMFRDYDLNTFIDAGYPLPVRAKHHVIG